MERFYAPPKISKRVKELGWKSIVFRWYDKKGDFVNSIDQDIDSPAMLWDQIFYWFREQKLHGAIFPITVTDWTFKIISLDNSVDSFSSRHYESYEEAREDCVIKMCEMLE